MAELRPFRGLRPPEALVQRVAAPPYDVVSTEEARAYARGNEHCFFHVSRPEVDFPPGTDEHGEPVYQRGRENLEAFLRRGWLQRDAQATLYVYRQRMGSHVQVGLVAGASVEEYDRGLIKRHELTRADKEDDRTRHVDVLGANDEPVFLAYRADPSIHALVAEATQGAPTYDFVTEDGIGHTFWVMAPAHAERVARAFASVPCLYIADGHHRSAAASRVRALRRARGRGAGGHDAFLAVVFPHDQLQILPYHRVVRDVQGRTPEQLLEAVRERFEVRPAARPEPERPHTFGMYLAGRWHTLEARPGTFPDTPVGSLDVSILQENLLAPVLGIQEPRKDPRIHFVGGIRGTPELVRLVDSRAYEVAFALYPTRMEQLIAISDAGGIMPPKSTWFEPKLRSGLVLHPFD